MLKEFFVRDIKFKKGKRVGKFDRVLATSEREAIDIWEKRRSINPFFITEIEPIPRIKPKRRR